MLKIRLSRRGKSHQPYFRIIVIEHWRKPKGKYIEMLGNYNPRNKEISLKQERIKYWLSVGAQLSPRVHNLLVDQKIIKGPKIKATKLRKKSIDKKEKEDKIKTKVEQAEAQADAK